MNRHPFRTVRISVVALAAIAAACGSAARLAVADGTGPAPSLPEPRESLIPTVKIAPAKGWAPNATPQPAPNLVVSAFARGLDHPRWLYVLPNGDVLVAETNAPKRPDDSKGLKGWFMKRYMKKAGAAVPSANRITLLRDRDGDGVAETRTVLIDSLYSPFGMTFIGSDLYVASSDALVRFPYRIGDTRITERGSTVVGLPAGTINHHWTKNVVASPDGLKLYVSVGSNSNVVENGIAAEAERAAIWEVDPNRNAPRVRVRTAKSGRNGVGVRPRHALGRRKRA